jgi:HK97 family phage major capsid protein
MTRALEVQERLKELAAEMGALADAETLTEDQSAQYDAFEKEADDLTVELSELKAADEREVRRKKADSVRDFAKSSSRVTTPNQVGGSIRVRPVIADDPKRGFKCFADFVTRLTDNHANVRGDEMLMQIAAGTGMTSAVNTEGGVLVPPAFAKSIWDRVRTKSNSLLQYCDVVTLDNGVVPTVPAWAASGVTGRAN